MKQRDSCTTRFDMIDRMLIVVFDIANRLLRAICFLWVVWHIGQSNLTVGSPFTLLRCRYMLSMAH